MKKIALAVLLSIGLGGFAPAREDDPHAGTAAGARGTEAPLAVTAIKSIVNHSRFAVEVRNTENPHRFRNGADVPPINTTTLPPPPQPVDMWIPWAQTRSEFQTHHISVVLRDGDRVVRRFAIWQRASFDGDFVRIGEGLDLARPETPYSEPGARICCAPGAGGDRTLTVELNGDLTLAGYRPAP
jgi:hypothetical protein